jgi:hypothetical protein
MKKLLSIVLVTAMAVLAFAACAPAAAPAPQEVKVYQGSGHTILFREGPGKDDTEVPVYSFTYVTANVTFDADGKIIDSYVDALEVASPNYDGPNMPNFSGWPGTAGYNTWDHTQNKTTGAVPVTVDMAKAEVNGWLSKRERGDNYGMNPKNDWHKQMDAYQNFFKGKTIAEIEAWFAKFASDRNGRPLDPATTNEQDKAKVAKLTADEIKAISRSWSQIRLPFR